MHYRHETASQTPHFHLVCLTQPVRRMKPLAVPQEAPRTTNIRPEHARKALPLGVHYREVTTAAKSVDLLARPTPSSSELGAFYKRLC